MTDTQILTIAIALIVPLAAVLFNNKRLDDTNSRIDRVETSLKTEIGQMEKRVIAHLDNAFQHMELLLKLHEAEHHKK